MKTALLIMAAGIGSRYKEGIKQLAQVGPNKETLLEYAIYDAIEAGFDKLVFVIRKEIEEAFHAQIGEKLTGKIEVCYCYQDLTDIPEGYKLNPERTKPLGTGQAVLAARDCIKEPFAVINADDYYGRDGFKKLHDYLVDSIKEDEKKVAMVGFKLGNTLSDNGGVTRGICSVDGDNFVTGIVETSNIEKSASGPVVKNEDGSVKNQYKNDDFASMNMWGFAPTFMGLLQKGFKEFLDKEAGSMKGEYLLPEYVNTLVKSKEVTVKVLSTDAHWYGMTYHEDTDKVRAAIADMIKKGDYPEKLF